MPVALNWVYARSLPADGKMRPGRYDLLVGDFDLVGSICAPLRAEFISLVFVSPGRALVPGEMGNAALWTADGGEEPAAAS